MDEEQKETPAEDPVAPGVSAPGNSTPEPSPSQDSVQAEVSEGTAKGTQEYQPRYLGKKYSDISELEKAHESTLRETQNVVTEKNALAQKVEQLEQSLKQYGITQEQPVAETQPSPVDIEAQIEQRLAPVKRQMALREEADAVQEVIRLKPHLAAVAPRLIQAWRQSGNEPLSNIVSDFEKVFNTGRNTNKEDEAAKKDQIVETGKGAGEIQIKTSAEDRKRAARGGADSLAAVLPDDLGVL